MRTLIPAVAAVAAVAAFVLGTSAPAVAQSKSARVAGTYDVTYEDLANNCTQVSFAMSKGSLTITKKKDAERITVSIPSMPVMEGKRSDEGTFRANAKRGPTSIQGVQGKFSTTGKVNGKALEMVLMAELYVDNKPLCTQSWNVKGTRK